MDGVSCARCAAGNGCGAGLIGQSREPRQLEVPLQPGMTLRTGDRVHISLQPRRVLQAALLAYGLPLGGISLALGVALLFEPSLSDPGAVVYAVLGGTAGLLLGRQFLRRDACLQKFAPQISRQRRADDLATTQHDA